VDAFLKELKAKRAADLNAVLVTLNDGRLCRLALLHWVSNGWVVVAPHSPLTALPGPSFHPGIGLHEFCGVDPDNSDAGEGERGRPRDEDS
jgi:hypothetical protein